MVQQCHSPFANTAHHCSSAKESGRLQVKSCFSDDVEAEKQRARAALQLYKPKQLDDIPLPARGTRDHPHDNLENWRSLEAFLPAISLLLLAEIFYRHFPEILEKVDPNQIWLYLYCGTEDPKIAADSISAITL